MSESDNKDDPGRRLYVSRRAHRGQMTKLMKKAESLMPADQPLSEAMLVDMRGLVKSINQKLDTLKELDKQLCELATDDDLEGLIVESDDYIESISAKINVFENTVNPPTGPPTPQSDADTSLNNTLLASTQRRKVNLPKLNLQSFDGDILKWTSFYDAFNAAIHSDENLDSIQKFQYLRSVLSGEAARAIEGLPLTNANYAEALHVLKQRYGQTHKITASFMKALWELPKPTEAIASIKSFHDNLETYIRGLRSLGKTEDTYGELLVPIVLEKLPGYLKSNMSRIHGDKAWTIPELQKAIYKEIQAAEAGDPAVPQDPYATFPAEHTQSTAAFHIGGKSGQAGRPKYKTKPHCVFCKGDHYPSNCVKVTDKAKRNDIVKRDKLCFNCLRSNHMVGNCAANGRCRECKRKHHTSLCMKPAQTKPEDTPGKPEETHVKLTPTGEIPTGPVLLKTASTKLWHMDKVITVNILFDEGAQRSFITQRAVKELQISPQACHQEDINLSTFGQDSPQNKAVDVVQLGLEVKSGEKLNISALIVPKISSPMKNYVQPSVLKHKYLQDLPLADHVTGDTFEIDLLVGADHYWSIVDDHTVRGSGPTAVASKLGYLLSGPTHLHNVSIMNTMICKILVGDVNPDLKVSEYWNLETIGIKEEPDSIDCELENYRDKQLRYENGKYVAGLPWKADHAELPTNYDICYARTRSMVKRLTEVERQVYDRIIRDQLAQGFIEPVENDDRKCGHYIPHHAVRKDSTTTPIRIVYDCSCSQGGNPSLNDCLDTGPCMINDLVDIILRFRKHPIAFVSDIEKAFLNIQLAHRDRKYTKFLWLSDPNDPNSEFNVYQFSAVLFGCVSSPFMLNAVIRTHLEQYASPTTEDLLDNIYVDNVVSGTDDDTKATAYYEESVKLLQHAGFNLRSWCTNSPTIQAVIEADNNYDTESVVKVLGLLWDSATDTLSYQPSAQPYSPSDVCTKREVLKATSSLFDPLGFLSPVHIRAKIFIQKLWTLHLGWDEPLSQELVEEWTSIFQELELARKTVFNRQYFVESQDGSYELHVFSDASLKAYGAVAFIKHGNETSFVIAKSRVKPLKDITLPRLELLATVIATQIANLVVSALRIQFLKIVLWCDSQIVLHWIKSSKKLPIFIENRLKTIKAGPFTEVKYCPSNENPADLLTRGLSNKEYCDNKLWKGGPPWLIDGDWPICEVIDSVILTCQSEYTVDILADKPDVPMEQEHIHDICQIIDISRFGSLGKLLRVTCYVLRFIRRLKQGKANTCNFKQYISVPELNSAEHMWIKAIQSDEFGKELNVFRSNVRVKNSLVRQLKLFLDETQVIRCGGRLQNANMNFGARHPILLPVKHEFTKLVVKQMHVHMLHAGLEITISAIRKTFWIPRIRQVVKAVIRLCVICLKVKGHPYKMPQTPPLPQVRLLEAPPFTVCGVDFTGALYYKTLESKSNKAYICLFTCAVTRAIHLEVVTDMRANTFILAFRRFASQCSLPRNMISDNGLTFVSGAEDIQNLCKNPEILGYLANKKVEWTFIPKRAPWFGGFYERLVGVTKSALKKVLGRALVTLDELKTLIMEIETSINERPITYTSTDLSEPEPLSPSMLVHGRSITMLPHLNDVTSDELSDPSYGVTRNTLDSRVRRLDALFVQLWKRWRDEYLPHLRAAHQANEKKRGLGTSINTIKTGDVVLVHSDCNRSLWPLGVVTELKLGNDGLVRSAELRTKFGVTNRPITKLYPLEVSLSQAQPEQQDKLSEETKDDDTIGITHSLPRRQAAVKARTLLKKWSSELLS